jgi:phage gp16-like protein
MPDPTRTKDLKKIHIAKRDLAMTDGSYRAMLQRLTGHDSAGKLNAHQRQAVLAEFRRLGWKPRSKKGGRRPHNLDREAQLQKIEAQLTDMGLPWRYADAIANRMFHIERVEWLRERKHRDAIIAALWREQKKRHLLTAVDEILADLGRDRSDLDRYQLRPGWERHLPTLTALAGRLFAEWMSALKEENAS